MDQMQGPPWAFPIQTVPVYAANRQISPLRAIVRDDNDASVLGIVGRSFKVVRHDELISLVDRAVERLGCEFTRSVVMTKQGARLYATYDFPLVVEEVAVGDVVALRLLLRNAYDGSARVGFNVGAQRLVCKNGLTSFASWFGISSKHTSSLDLDALLSSVSRVFTSYQQSVLPFWRELAGRGISNAEARQFIVDACGYIGDEAGDAPTAGKEAWFPRKYFESVHRQWVTPANESPAEMARTLWTLLNAFAYVITHDIQPRSYENALRLRQRTEVAFKALSN